MKLVQARVTNFRSVWASNDFEIGDVTCLVGKNEAGKTALLHAIYRLNPIVEADGTFDVTDDYPRTEVEDYRQDLEAGRSGSATVVELTFELEDDERARVEAKFGANVLPKGRVTVAKGYPKTGQAQPGWLLGIPVKEAAIVKHLVEVARVPEPVASQAATRTKVSDLSGYVDEIEAAHLAELERQRAEAAKIADEEERKAALALVQATHEPPEVAALRALVKPMLAKPLWQLIWDEVSGGLPKFLYFDEYYQLQGHDNIQALKQRKDSGTLQPSDLPLLGLIDLARLDLAALLTPERTQELKNRLEGASNHLTKKILKYWSQNRHLRMVFDVRPGLPKDPAGMQQGTNIWGEVQDQKHLASTGLATRSRGFVWFFSFLAWYSSEKKKDQRLVLLLDEPGLSLHGRAQQDLLRYFEEEIASNPKHQLIYTTHSPFMVDPRRFDRVRIVQDKGIDSDEELPRDEDGTKVLKDVLEAGEDSLFPLQGAFGYDITQTLFVGPNSLVVEGVSDLLYVQAMSGILEGLGRTSLDERWTVTPVGGAEKVPTFVALLGAQRGLKIATLIDYQKSGQQEIENLFKRKLLSKNRVLTFADFTNKSESDIEDMFTADEYLTFVSKEYGTKVNEADLTHQAPRILARLKAHFTQKPLPKATPLNHFRPARWFAENSSSVKLSAETLDRFEAAFAALNALL